MRFLSCKQFTPTSIFSNSEEAAWILDLQNPLNFLLHLPSGKLCMIPRVGFVVISTNKTFSAHYILHCQENKITAGSLVQFQWPHNLIEELLLWYIQSCSCKGSSLLWSPLGFKHWLCGNDSTSIDDCTQGNRATATIQNQPFIFTFACFKFQACRVLTHFGECSHLLIAFQAACISGPHFIQGIVSHRELCPVSASRFLPWIFYDYLFFLLLITHKSDEEKMHNECKFETLQLFSTWKLTRYMKKH